MLTPHTFKLISVIGIISNASALWSKGEMLYRAYELDRDEYRQCAAENMRSIRSKNEN